MTDSPIRESPLVQFLAEHEGRSQPGDAGVYLSERPFLGHLNLQGDPDDAAFLEAVGEVVGTSLPVEPNTVAESDHVTALWLGPNEWLLLTASDEQAGVEEALRAALGDRLYAITDLSGGQTVINLRGRNAREVLAKGCTLDLHPRVFGPGQCAQSNVAKTIAVIRPLAGEEDSPSFDLIVRRSFADYLARWLEDASREYGLSIVMDKP